MATLTRRQDRAVPVPQELLRSVAAYFDPVRVSPFGSHARGEAGPDSDYGLLVVLDDATRPRRSYTGAPPGRPARTYTGFTKY